MVDTHRERELIKVCESWPGHGNPQNKKRQCHFYGFPFFFNKSHFVVNPIVCGV